MSTAATETRRGRIENQVLFAIFFFAFTGTIELTDASSIQLRECGWLVALPVWIVVSTAFGFWVPRFLRHRRLRACAVFSPVWAEWPEAEKQRRDRQSVGAADRNPIHT